VAVVVDALTDNRTRTITDVRLAFSTNGGNVGASGCVAYMFLSRGQIVIAGEGVSGEKLMEAAIEAGATDVGEPEGPEGVWVISTEVADFQRVKDALEKAGFAIEQAELALIPETRVAVQGEQAESNASLIEELEDLDDVQKVWSNADFPDGE
jgi:YebC/PmpR family DNA-binding regulatory protein